MINLKGTLVGPKGVPIKARIVLTMVAHTPRLGSETPFGRSAEFASNDQGEYEQEVESGSYDVAIDWGEGVRPFGDFKVTADMSGNYALLYLMGASAVTLTEAETLHIEATAMRGVMVDARDDTLGYRNSAQGYATEASTSATEARDFAIAADISATTAITYGNMATEAAETAATEAAELAAQNVPVILTNAVREDIEAAAEAVAAAELAAQTVPITLTNAVREDMEAASDSAEDADGFATSASLSATSASASDAAAGEKVAYLQGLIEQGTPGPAGQDGNVTLIKYSPDGNGDWSDTQRDTDHFMRICVDTGTGNFECGPAALFSPRQGIDFSHGTDGTDGTDGYSVAVQYSSDNSMWHYGYQAGDRYVRTGTNQTGEFVFGEGGLFVPTKGVDYDDGDDGINSWLHTKYSNDEGVTFTGNGGEALGSWIGFARTTSVENPSGDDPTNPADYNWSRVEGIDGAPGADGQSAYEQWLSDGNSGSMTAFLNSLRGSDGADGSNGIPGAPGADGRTTYTWIKYADNNTGSSGFSNSPGDRAYVGFAFNKTTATESDNASDYNWSLIRGADGDPGAPGADGADGADGEDGDDGARGPGFFRRAVDNLSGWSNNEANAATTGSNRPDDVVTLYDSSDQTVSFTRRWNGASWVAAALYVDGDMLAEGTVQGDRLVSTTEIIGPTVRSMNKPYPTSLGAGYFMGSHDGQAKLSVGDALSGIYWDGEKLKVKGDIGADAFYCGAGTIVTTYRTDSSTLEVEATSAFASSGGLLIGGRTFNYTGKTATSFTGVTPTSLSMPILVGTPVVATDGSIVIDKETGSICSKDWSFGLDNGSYAGYNNLHRAAHTLHTNGSTSRDLQSRLPTTMGPDIHDMYPWRSTLHVTRSNYGWAAVFEGGLYCSDHDDYATAAYIDGKATVSKNLTVSQNLTVGGSITSNTPNYYFLTEYVGSNTWYDPHSAQLSGELDRYINTPIRGADYIPNGVFTAPVSGVYHFTLQVYGWEQASLQGWGIKLKVSSGIAYLNIKVADGEYFVNSLSVDIPLDANDTVTPWTIVVGSGVVKIKGNSAYPNERRTFFTGHLISKD